ncbi:MAG: LPS export ABC transporter permease LptF, partial [Candidatus Binatia bacterium]
MRPRMGKTLHRYLLRELASAFLVGMGVFTFILLVSRILELVDLIVARGVPGHRVLALFAYILPSFMELTIPMALLLAVVVAFGRLATDGEMIAMRSAGISLYQMLSPSMYFAVAVALSTFVLAAWGRPWANHQIKETLYDMARDRATAALRPRVFNSEFNGLVVYVDRIDRENGLMKGIMVADERDSYRRTTMIASSGRMVSNEQTRSIYLMLLDGTSLSFHAGQESYDKTDFASLEVNLDIEAQIAAARSRAPEPRELTWQQLLAARAGRLAVGDPATEENIEINRKLVLPVASIVLALFGVPLGMQRSR